MTIDYEFDEMDEQIIKLLQEDGRSSNRAVSRALGVSEGAVRKRLKKMKEAGAISYGLVVDVRATGMDSSCWLTVTARPADVRHVANFIASLEACSLCCLSTGERSIHAYVYGRDRAALGQTAATIKSKKGVLDVTVREALSHAQHRYELIMLPDKQRISRWKMAGGLEKP